MRSSSLSPTALRSFVAVAEHGSLTAAARSLCCSQPSLSMHLGELEHELGVSLVVRSRPRVTLTPAGRRLLDRAREALQVFAALDHELRSCVHEVMGSEAS